VQTRAGLLLTDVASIAQQAFRARDWQRLSQSLGTKGERLFDWARLPIVHAGVADGRHWLVVRRCLDDPHELAYYLVWAPPQTPLPTMVAAIGARWRIEEDLEATKALGLDHYEVRSYLGWYRHLTLVLLAYAFLVDITVHSHLTTAAQQESVACPPLIALSTSEARHLLAHLFWPAPTSAPLICQWSIFRRTHQYWAGYYHRRRRKISRVSLLVEPPDLPSTFAGSSPGNFLALFPGKFPGVFLGGCQAGSRSCCTPHTKGVIL